ncbi:MAG: undecaprenyl-diphosphate phosphatase [Sulfurospirillaceae bacterium]
MGFLEAFILGVVEGLTEFLPVSSTGHLIVTSHFLNLEQNAQTKAFEIIIQFSAILAVLFAYKEHFSFKKIILWQKIFVSFLPIGIIGFLFASFIKNLFSVNIVAWAFIIGGVVFLITEKFYKEKEHFVNEVDKISWKQAIFIGLAQVLALIPGASRAGATIVGALWVGLDRKTSARFSFLLAIPVMVAVTGYDLVKHHDKFLGNDMFALMIGFITSFIVAYFSMRAFMVFLEHFTFVFFGIYRIILGVVLLLFFI